MATPTSSKPDPKDDLDDESTAAVIEGPPEEDFDEKYNKRLEFPLSLVSTILIHVAVLAVIVILFTVFLKGNDRSDVPVKLVNLAGYDDGGEGSAGSGGNVDDATFKADGDPDTAKADSLLDPSKLPEIKEKVRESLKYLDPEGKMPLSDSNAQAYKDLNEKVREKLLGQRRGSGSEKGTGFDDSKGKGPGGTGADSTLGRNMRWVLRFKVSGGRDYLDQLKAMGAEILVPIPGSEKCILIENLDNPSNQRTATDDDMARLANKIKFSDNRAGAVRDVAAALKLSDVNPKSFWAFFPKGIEEELSRKETSYRNRRADDIEETIFRVTVSGSNYTFLVDEQTVKK